MTEFSETLLENKEIIFKNGVKNVQAVGYNGTQTVPNTHTRTLTTKSDLSLIHLHHLEIFYVHICS